MAETRRYVCDWSRKAAAPDDSYSDEIDLPIGWVEIALTRVESNPDYPGAVALMQGALAGIEEQLRQGAGLDDATLAAALAAEERRLAADLPPRVIVETSVRHAHPEVAADVLGRLGGG